MPKENTGPRNQSEGGEDIEADVDAEHGNTFHAEQDAVDQIPDEKNDKL